jgi:ribosome biogenesis GTPase A
MNQLIAHPFLEVRDCAVALRQKLTEAKKHELPSYRPYLDKQIKSLDDALTVAKIPDFYRVAIVGRFKVGKSSFVNKLTDERLTGVETAPKPPPSRSSATPRMRTLRSSSSPPANGRNSSKLTRPTRPIPKPSATPVSPSSTSVAL